MADKPDGKYELAVGKLACSEELVLGSTLVSEQEHSKVLAPVPVPEHSMVQGQALEHNKVLALVQVHSKEPVLVLVHSKEQVQVPEYRPVLVPVHSKELVPGLAHNKELEQEHSKVLEPEQVLGSKLVLEQDRLDRKMVQEHKLVSCSNYLEVLVEAHMKNA